MLKFTNINQFNKTLKKFVDKTSIAPGKVVRKISFDLLRKVVEKTPVDMGWAQNNWNIAEGNPDPAVDPPEPPTEKMGEPNVDAKIVRITQAEVFPVIFVSNNLPYIIPLENGHSKQMDKGYMVQRSLAEVQAEMRKYLEGLD